MEQTKPISHIIKGVIIAVVLMALNFFARKTGIVLPSPLQFLPTILLAAGVIISCTLFGSQTGGTLAFGDIFAHGFKTTAVVTFFIAVYTFIIVKFVFPLTAHDIDVAVKAMQVQGNMMEQEARRSAAEYAKKSWVLDVGGAIFATVITGLVGSVIGAALAKKKA